MSSKYPNKYRDVFGWFGYEQLYWQVVNTLPAGSTLVEVGSYVGRSTCFLAESCRILDKQMEIYAVDTWRGSPEHEDETMEFTNGTGLLRPVFEKNLEEAGVLDIITPMEMTSLEAAEKFEDDSLDFVLIDANHDYEPVLADITAWYPKLKPRRIMAGDDWAWNSPHEGRSVFNAVNKFFNPLGLRIRIIGSAWSVIKP